MKVRIKGHSGEPLSISSWWYAEHIGEVFEVEEDPKLSEYFYTYQEFKGKQEKHHIKKTDCEVVDQEEVA